MRLGFGIGDLDLGLEIWIGDWEWGLIGVWELGLEICIKDWDWGLRLGIGNWDWIMIMMYKY